MDRCDVCGGQDLELVLDLGTSPATCHMRPVGSTATEERHPLQLLRCADCGFVCLSVVVDKDEVFPPDYPYSSGNSPALHRNFEDLASRCDVGPEDLVVDIGANDGTLLSKFSCRKVGVEPTSQAEKIERGVDVYQDHFDESLARHIRLAFGPAKVVTACNVLAHVDDIHDVMRGIDVLLAHDGVLIAENHDLRSVVDGQWDTVYHEHLRYFSANSFNGLLKHHGFEMQQGYSVPTHGGSYRTIATRLKSERPWNPPTEPADWDAVARSAESTRNRLRHGGSLVGIGATARATTIINYCGLDVEDIPYVCEVPGSDKIGRYIPGTRIPIVDESELGDRDALLFSWHLADSIVVKLRVGGYKGRLYAPLPTFREL